MENQNIVGVIPAAGNALRLSPIPCSKEIFPIGFEKSGQSTTIKVAVSDLLEGMEEAGARQLYMILRKGKWDIPAYLGTGLSARYTLSYIITDPTPGTHYSIDSAYHFMKDKTVLLGFPDILFNPKHVFADLLKQQRYSGADVVLGLFKTDNPAKADMVELDDSGQVTEIVIKPESTPLHYCWAMAVWSPAFTEYLHDFISDLTNKAFHPSRPEIFIGNVMQHAMKDGLVIEGVRFPDGHFTDIGTLADLKRAWNHKR